MALDKSVVKRIAIQTGLDGTYPSVYLKEMDDFAQAIYALGAADERDRCCFVAFKLVGSKFVDIEAASDIAEAIRKGETT